ncbi:type VI secretion system needle syringe protein TssI [Syntrophotalea carbinolica DSM 2380]|uniref:Type VI secretion system needle syringe protein TssI n=1 Tax=Syntrophotalea carbinolica (strain DSM 2380 / NBRC 103641 / GraBd1) TaxID=338963 RepID=Q3A0Q0_SYNC1|nr:type VI secretion system tip protein VgrG [Syntrophotalea carbinolica]ABA90057.1 type VI secretion system needle syringe protein TssI [Syntrophotalea carbinolica DSM 2380]
MSLSARQSRLHLELGDAGFSVLGLSGKEELNRPFAFDVSVLADSFAALLDCLGAPVSLFMTAPDGYERRLNGILTEARVETDLADGRSIVCLSVASRLALLQLRTDSRLILSETLPAIVRQTLCRNGIDENALRLELARQYPVRPSTLQAQENDLDFLLRLTGRQGMFIWTDAADDHEILHIADTTNRCPMLARELLTYTPNAGMETDKGPGKVGMLGIIDRAEMVPARHWVHDVHENAPEHPILSGRASDQANAPARDAAGTSAVNFGSGLANEEEAKHEAVIRAQRSNCIRQTLSIRTHAADLRAGAIIRLDTSGYSCTLGGDYLIVSVEHTARQYGGLGLTGQADSPYTNTAVLVRRETPWRPEIKPVGELPLIFSARIESRDELAQLDSAGRYNYRQYPDSNSAAHAEASASVRRLQPYASPSETLPAGWHLPLHDANEVLISCLNNDPDRPMLVGTLANPARRSVVTEENAHQNRLLTAGGNDLTMDDWRDKSAISLCTFNGHNMLHLNADVLGHRVNLVSSQGQMECYAKKTMATHSGDTLTETVSNNRLQQIENRHGTTTNKKEVHHQANTDGDISAAEHIQMESGQNTELTAGQDMRLDITESTRIQVREQDALIHIDSGSLTVQAEQAITIEGDGKGEIVFEQNGGGFRMAPNGDITLYGDEISLSADAINFYGPISKEVTAPDAVPATGVAEVLTAKAISDLASEQPSDAITILLEDFYGNELDGHFQKLKGRPWRFLSDMGDERTGVIKDHVIQISGVHINRCFQFGIKDIKLNIGED